MHTAARNILESTGKLVESWPGADNWEKVANAMPWYATAHVALAMQPGADTTDKLRMAALFVNDPMRLYVLLNAGDAEWDSWLKEKCATEQEDSGTGSGEPPIPIQHEDLQPSPDLPAPESLAEAPGLADIVIVSEEVPSPAALPESQGEIVEDSPAGSTEPAREDVPLAFKLDLPDLKTAPEEAADEDLLFEPYHTVDYFASQGIKVDKETPPLPKREKFDRQLKSFTQWLRTMKPIHYESADVPTDPEVDAQAKASLQSRVVETEAMAEVLVKQGKLEQAAEIYRKLMLLHPEKSTFFAARLEALKV